MINLSLTQNEQKNLSKDEAETLSCDTDMFRHTDVLLTTSSGKQYIINYLEDMENIQSGMKTPDFASYPYYEKRYKKFNMYMDSVIDQIKTEFLHFRDIMAQNECIETLQKKE